MPIEKQEPITKKGKEMKLKLKESGRVVFGEKGYLDTRLSDITNHANISEGNFYRYFLNKDDLLEELLEDMITDLYEGSKVHTYTDDLKERLEYSTKGLFLSYQKHAKLYKVLLQVSNFNPKFMEIWKRLRKPFIERVKRNLEKQDIREEYDLDYLSSALGSMVQQFAYIWCVLDGEDIDKKFDIDEATKTVSDIWYQTIISFQKLDKEIDKLPNS